MKYQFPEGFLWGSATAALQIEGGAAADGRGPSVWDVFCREHPEKIFERATPDVTCDHYHRYEEDVRWIRELGHNAYRLSISWPRLFPEGSGALNQAGVDFYRRLFDLLRSNGVTPHVTLYHWDLPDALARRGGWENPETIAAFEAFAAACFEHFGDQVELWSTLNEPGWTTLNGYVTALHPPGKTDLKAAVQVATNFLIAHARVARSFHKAGRRGKIGLALNLSPVYPATDTAEDRQAASLADAIFNRWFFEPLLLGRFPEEALALYNRCGFLPEISADDRALLAAPSADFVGVNYYYPHHVSAEASGNDFHLNTSGRQDENCRFSIGGLFRFVRNPRGQYTDWAWEIHPDGLYELLIRLRDLRPDLPVYVTENGIGRVEELAGGTVDDQERIDFVRLHLEAIHRAIQAGCPVRGYFMWALMDNFSWINGFKKRYGFLFIDRQTLARYPKKSAAWFREAARRNGF